MKGTIRIAVIEFPGTNCEQETAEAIIRAGMEPVYHRWNMSHKLLEAYDGFIIPGGFSYEDRSRSGVIASQDPLILKLREQSEAGKPILGICNGAQILVESGLVPGIEGYRIGAALAENRRMQDGKIQGTGFYNAWVNIIADQESRNSAFIDKGSHQSPMTMPAAHAEGRFTFTPEVLETIRQRGLIAFRYCDESSTSSPEFPVNPNGSQDNCAGLFNAAGNAMALMPHPERTHGGDRIFTAMRSYIERNRELKPEYPEFLPKELAALSREPERYAAPSDCREIIVGLIITDNAAVSVEQALRSQGADVSVKRYVHWEICFEPGLTEDEQDNVIEQIAKSGELYNPNKEYETKIEPEENDYCRLVRQHEDTRGEHVSFTLTNWFSIRGITSIRHGIIWSIHPDKATDNWKSVEIIETSHLLANPISYRSLKYEQN